MGFADKNSSHERGGVIRRTVAGWMLFAVLMGVTAAMRAEETNPTAAVEEPLIGAAPEEATPVQEFDELVYSDGDRVRGHFVERDGETIVFQSSRFGVLRVTEADAKLMLAAPGKQTAVADATTDGTAGESGVIGDAGAAGHEGSSYLSYLSPHALGMKLQRFFGPWHGRLSFSSEVVSDTTDRSTAMTELKIGRKWAKDDLQGTLRYDYSDTNGITATDIAKLGVNWRHDFTKRYFGLYNSLAEWNRAYVFDGAPSKYLLVQQELGAGISLRNTDRSKVRVGLSQNVFEVWLSPSGGHTLIAAESLFGEVEAKLPWQITLTDRGVLYYVPETGKDGFENRFEVNKKLTETISMGVRHEVRFNSPDERVSDYSLLKFLIGVDF